MILTLVILTQIFETFAFDCDNRLGLVANPEDCQSFYYCDPTGTSLEYCLDGLLFDENILVCNYENDVDCVDRPVIDHITTTKSPTTPITTTKMIPTIMTTTMKRTVATTTPNPQATQTFDCGNSYGLVSNPKDCQSFYYCSSNGASLEYCLDGLLFDESILVCNYAGAVDCGNRQMTSTISSTVVTAIETSTPVKSPANSFDCGNNYGLVADPENCQSFYYCDSNGASIEYCLDGLLFDENFLVCNYENNVDCGNRTLPYTNFPTTNLPTPASSKNSSPPLQTTSQPKIPTPPPTTTTASATSIDEKNNFFRYMIAMLTCALFLKVYS